MSESKKDDVFAIPFFVADAWLERLTSIFDEPSLRRSFITTKRYQLSTGSARIDTFYRGKKVGTFKLFAASTQITILETITLSDEAANKIMSLLYAGFLPALMQVTLRSIKGDEQVDIQLKSVRDEVRAGADEISKDYAPEPQVPRAPREPPAKDAPIDAWLDWREAELKRKHPPRSVSFSKLAEQSNYTEAQFKHASSARRRSKT